MARTPIIPALSVGDIVDVVAPGFRSSFEDLQKAKEFLESKGFKPRIPNNIFGDHPIHSNTDEHRAEQLIQALTSRDSKAVWFLRGGYGTNRLLPYLRKIKKPSKPKMLIGISDLTSLHIFVLQKWGWSFLHGSLLDRIGKGLLPFDVQNELERVVFGEQTEVEFSGLEALNRAALVKKTIHGTVVGGNLKVIESHLGTVDKLSFQNRIVMFEEIGERGYRVDRMLFHLDQSKSFLKCKAVVFGTFTMADEPGNAPSLVPQVLKAWAAAQKFPVFQGLPCGHDTVQRVIPLGTPAKLQMGKAGKLTVKTGVKK